LKETPPSNSTKSILSYPKLPKNLKEQLLHLNQPLYLDSAPKFQTQETSKLEYNVVEDLKKMKEIFLSWTYINSSTKGPFVASLKGT
jgi:hypothetical protein